MTTTLHPIVEQMSPSDEQIGAIQHRHSDVAVAAGAGAGKTRTLVARYLALLTEGLPLRSVVAITFTKKAAREMRNRVREEVRRYLEKPELSEEERTCWQEIYTGLDAARIGTIHSLCAEILRHHPAEASIDPRFEMLEEGQMALLQAQVVEEALRWAVNNSQVVPLFVLLGEHGVRQLGGAILQHRLEMPELWQQLPCDPPTLLKRWESILAEARDAAWQAFLSNPAFAEAQQTLEQSVPLDAGDRIAQQRALALAALTRDDVPATEAFADLDNINLTGGSQKAWAGGKDELKEIKAALRALRDLWQEHEELLTLTLGEVDYALAEHYPALHALADWICEHYTMLKVARQALDFDDLEARAVALLAEHAAVRTYWQQEIRALLVDEFQDTNGRQRDLVDLLDGGSGKRFIVGDGKQSIYRFRGADVTVFREVWKEIRANGQTFTLATSYRAHAKLITSLNALLEPALGPEEDPARPYVEPFAALTPYREAPVAGLDPPFVELHLAGGTKKDGALDRAAQAMTRRLVALVNSGVTIREDDPERGLGVMRPLNYGDIAILCRASTSFSAYEDALEAAGIPFLTVAGRGFYERPEVRDVLNALQAIADPTDDLALVGLLRSPVIGISDIGLYRLCTAREAPHTLWEVLSGADRSFLEDEASQAEKACVLIKSLHELSGRVPVADVLKAFLDATDYQAALLQAGQPRGVNNLSKLLADAHTSEIVGVNAFLAYVGQLRDVGTREGEARAVGHGAVQLLTIHAAKGLEFPIVVIGDAAKGTTASRSPIVRLEMGILPPLKQEKITDDGPKGARIEKQEATIYTVAKQQEKDQEEAEADRLLYVAATRAQELLLISGTFSIGRNGISTDGWLKQLDLSLGLCEQAPACDAEGDAIHTLTLELSGEPVRCVLYEPKAGISPVSAALPAPSPMALPEALPMLEPVTGEMPPGDPKVREGEQDPPRRVWRVVPQAARVRAPAWVVGQLVHSALAQWWFPDDGGTRDFYRWAGAEARRYGITDEAELRDAVQRTARMLRRFQGTPLHEQMETARRRLHEVPYSLAGPEGVESGIIDALFEAETGWSVVEFKTDTIRDAERLAHILAQGDYVAQVQRYRAAAEQLLGVRPKALLCLLNYAGAVRTVYIT